jgi:hypothetical protein
MIFRQFNRVKTRKNTNKLLLKSNDTFLLQKTRKKLKGILLLFCSNNI